MANIKSAKKRINVIKRKTAENRRVKDRLKSIIKEFESAVETGDLDVASEKLKLAEKKLKQAAAKGAVNKHAASRKVSRMTKRFNASKEAN